LINLQTGMQTDSLNLGGYVAATAAIVAGEAYLGTYDNRVLAITLAPLEIRWEYIHPQRKFPFYASAAVTDEWVFAGGRDKLIHAINRETGRAQWTFETRSKIEASPVVANDDLILATERGNIHRLSVSTGQEKWQFTAGSAIVASPAIAAGKMVIGTGDGEVLCFGAAEKK
ncbi:MAG: PQQ-binding-like beta-propeller repeat protein, partial [Calditrichaeota bacterium]|nr:PQQ-binding-like beta-propeller repeat protein [Calditrichota bacterium]